MPHYKNTPITNLTELVIDGRTKQIQWIKLTDELWFKSNFKEFSASSLTLAPGSLHPRYQGGDERRLYL